MAESNPGYHREEESPRPTHGFDRLIATRGETNAKRVTGTSPCAVPQNNGGDRDADNNGGPNDGDGCDV